MFNPEEFVKRDNSIIRKNIRLEINLNILPTITVMGNPTFNIGRIGMVPINAERLARLVGNALVGEFFYR